MTSKDSTPFPMIPVSKRSLSLRKKNYGVGIVDVDYQVQPRINGKKIVCKYYSTWAGMIERCYSDASMRKRPTYIGCSVVKGWHSFKGFREWMINQSWEGKELDKDIIVPGNKIYGPETCVFVSHAINSLLNDHGVSRGVFPQGVSYYKVNRKYIARFNRFGNEIYLGSFRTPEEASAVYREAKRLHILTIACCEPDIRVKQGLYRHSELLR
jgi:hypothetical protein